VEERKGEKTGKKLCELSKPDRNPRKCTTKTLNMDMMLPYSKAPSSENEKRKTKTLKKNTKKAKTTKQNRKTKKQKKGDTKKNRKMSGLRWGLF